MSKAAHLFQIIVRCANHAQTPRVRVLGRDTRAAAIDAAIRELRRIRNTARQGTDYDTWDLYDIDRGLVHRSLVGSGNARGEHTPVPSQDNDHGDTPPY